MKIAFVQTGGTIDKDYPRTQNGWAFEIGEAAFIRILSKVNLQNNFGFYHFSRKDSLDLKESDRFALRRYVEALPEKRLVITHGSDTLLQTAKVLDFISQKTIVLTASMLPEKFKDSDASFNLGMALAGAQILKQGVYIALQGQIGDWKGFERDENSGFFKFNTSQ